MNYEQPNLSQIKLISGDDKSFENELISIVKKELPKEIDEYKKSLEERNYYDIGQNVHKLKHKIAILSLERGYEIAVLYEEDIRNRQLKHKSEFESVLDSMKKFVEEL